MEIKITKLNKKDINQVVKIASESFSGLREKKNAKKWVLGNFLNSPRFQYFVAKNKTEVTGFILWQEKGGFRKESVLELEQIAVAEKFRGQGIAKKLILESFEDIKKYIKNRGSILKLIEVTTGVDNKAQELYKKTLGAKSECVVKDFFKGDEILMIKRYKL
jgi:ribosomal protein S18 acetylase RimI-like enzyme